jgi:hypothetical protein
VALFNTPGPTYTSFAASFHPQMSEDMLLRKAEVQYVAEISLDNRRVETFAAVAATCWPYPAGLKRDRRRNDLIFRGG